MKNIGKLRDAAFELRAMAYMIQQQRTDPIPPLPNEWENISWGMGQILFRLCRRLERIAAQLEDEQRSS